MRIEASGVGTIFEIDLLLDDPNFGAVYFDPPLRTPEGSSLTVTLGAAGVTVVGKLNAHVWMYVADPMRNY